MLVVGNNKNSLLLSSIVVPIVALTTMTLDFRLQNTLECFNSAVGYQFTNLQAYAVNGRMISAWRGSANISCDFSHIDAGIIVEICIALALCLEAEIFNRLQ